MSFDAETYALRNVAERCVNRLKKWWGVATRYEKRVVNYHAMVVIAALMLWLTNLAVICGLCRALGHLCRHSTLARRL